MDEVTLDIMGVKRRVFGDPHDPYFQQAQNHAGQSKALMHEVCCMVPGFRFMDVGANIGLTTLICSANDAAMVAVEPSPKTVAALRRTLATNDINAEVFAVAAGAAVDTARFTERDFAAGSSFDCEGAIEVPVRTLDDIFAESRLDKVDLLKIDVEGFEADVLVGAKDLLARFKPQVVMEFNAFAITANANKSPRALAEAVLELAGEFRIAGRDGIIVPTQIDLRDFLYLMMTTNEVIDIVFRPQ